MKKIKNYIKPTATNRYRRWVEKLKKRHTKHENWHAIDRIVAQDASLQHVYTTGYQQALRDVKRGLV